MSTSTDLEPDGLPERIVLIDAQPGLVTAWQQAFAEIGSIQILAGDYFQQPADAIVSPANSFGIMDGGLDLAIRDTLGYDVQSRLQEVIVEKYHGELPVGAAVIIETGHDRWPHLVAAPTMRIPESVSGTLNAYLAFRAVLVAVKNFNLSGGPRRIDSVVCSGLATGVGGMTAQRCARQMLLAYKSVLGPAAIGRFESIHKFHAELRRA